MRLPSRKTADAIIAIFCGVCVGVSAAIVAIAALTGVPVFVSIFVGTILILLWLGCLLLWAAT